MEKQETTFNQMVKLMPEEIKRVKNLSNTLQGLRNLITIYENHFKEKYTHGVNVVYEISRINILRSLRNENKLC